MTRSVDDVIAEVRARIAARSLPIPPREDEILLAKIDTLSAQLDAANAAIRDVEQVFNRAGQAWWEECHAPAIALARKGAP